MLTEKEYLESALMLKESESEATKRNNELRSKLKSIFTERDCITFPPPTGSKNILRLNQMAMSELEPEFQSKSKQLRAQVMDKAVPKFMNGK